MASLAEVKATLKQLDREIPYDINTAQRDPMKQALLKRVNAARDQAIPLIAEQLRSNVYGTPVERDCVLLLKQQYEKLKTPQTAISETLNTDIASADAEGEVIPAYIDKVNQSFLWVLDPIRTPIAATNQALIASRAGADLLPGSFSKPTAANAALLDLQKKAIIPYINAADRHDATAARGIARTAIAQIDTKIGDKLRQAHKRNILLQNKGKPAADIANQIVIARAVNVINSKTDVFCSKINQVKAMWNDRSWSTAAALGITGAEYGAKKAWGAITAIVNNPLTRAVVNIVAVPLKFIENHPKVTLAVGAYLYAGANPEVTTALGALATAVTNDASKAYEFVSNNILNLNLSDKAATVQEFVSPYLGSAFNFVRTCAGYCPGTGA